MTTKSYLSQIERLDCTIVNKTEEAKRLRNMVTSTTIEPKDVNVQTSPEQDKIGKIMSIVLDMESEVEKHIDKRDDIVRQIENIENTSYYDVLANKFILGKSIDEIATLKNYSLRQMKRIYKKALSNFEEKYGDLYL